MKSMMPYGIMGLEGVKKQHTHQPVMAIFVQTSLIFSCHHLTSVIFVSKN